MLFQILFGVEAELDEAFEQFVGGRANKVSQYQLFCVEPANIPQRKRDDVDGIPIITNA